ncbi:MAG TPA: tRNA preQ1(34) S-adenosylmethionine ribosyltransferase-isomerase QueA [Acidobacteriota bacterium]|nr:tRNA preQ1(34) S-adenosylmethionine ribosyltransferase-isomerase QueA [Acidobacteriota bacterium]
MKIEDFNYNLPPELIAQHPSGKRDASRLMVVDRSTGSFYHRIFKDLPKFITQEDLIVLNDSRVFPARLFARRPGTKESIEILLLQEVGPQKWKVLARPGRKLKLGTRLIFKQGELEAQVVKSVPDSPARTIQFSVKGRFWDQIERLGTMPLPPYIRRSKTAPEVEDSTDRQRYQTVYARERGSIAAPTAGLHFTPELLNQLNHCLITLHVGYGTFKLVTSEHVEEHTVDPEFYSIDPAAAEKIQRNKEQGGRIVAVGTTTTRVLETVAIKYGKIVGVKETTDLIIYPGFHFKVVDCLITNFHLPRSSLILLAAAFAGKDLLLSAYQEAIREGYRFYSYGDAMLIV